VTINKKTKRNQQAPHYLLPPGHGSWTSSKRGQWLFHTLVALATMVLTGLMFLQFFAMPSPDASAFCLE